MYINAEEHRLFELFRNELDNFRFQDCIKLEPIFTAIFLTLDEDYLRLIKDFEIALDTDDYNKAQLAYNELVKILPVGASHHAKLLRIQMSGLTRNIGE